MHNFSELIDRCTIFTLGALREANERTTDSLKLSGSTTLVKTLQMISLQKAILAVGMFSLFEAILQDRLSCSNGFAEAKKILNQHEDKAILERFINIELAINVLKHGRGKSYDALVEGDRTLTLNVKQLNKQLFNDGDVSEIASLINVNDKFIYHCAEIINQVSEVIRKARPEVIL